MTHYKRKRKTKRRESPEHILQVSYITWMRMQYPNVLVYATPNGAKRSPQYAAYLKAEGLVSGIADLTILMPSATHHLLFIEFKIPPNKPTKTQTDFIAYANSHNYLAHVCYSLDEAILVTKEHLRDYTYA